MLISMAKQGKCELHKIKWSENTIFGVFHLLHMLLVGAMQTTTKLHDARCKQ
jgi:hypothetical protein